MIETDVKEIIAKQIKKTSADIPLDLNLCKAEFIDSIDHVEIVMALEEKYHISITEDEAADSPLVLDVIHLVESKI